MLFTNSKNSFKSFGPFTKMIIVIPQTNVALKVRFCKYLFFKTSHKDVSIVRTNLLQLLLIRFDGKNLSQFKVVMF